MKIRHDGRYLRYDCSAYGNALFPAAQVQHAEQVLIRYLDETDGAYRYIERKTTSRLPGGRI
ncbi:MAG: hypothetical protein ACLRSW_08375 [Christensenellaceae bacterium]